MVDARETRVIIVIFLLIGALVDVSTFFLFQLVRSLIEQIYLMGRVNNPDTSEGLKLWEGLDPTWAKMLRSVPNSAITTV